MFLSSHLLDEVETICRRGGDLGPRARDRQRNDCRAECRRRQCFYASGAAIRPAALALLQGRPGIASVELLADGLRVRTNGRIDPAAINELLVRNGIRVSRLEPAHHSLEERFLQLTSRVEVAA